MIQTLAPDLRCIRAPNPSPMTEKGTNTYLLGRTDIALIDPGPKDTKHLEAILTALSPGQRISHILVTHSHHDHSGLVPELAQATGAPVYGFGPSHAGRSALMDRLAQDNTLAGGEGIDPDFAPDFILPDLAQIAGADWSLTAHWTPGHMANHLSFEWHEGRALFTGDTVMGWASSLISPPDGDVGQFFTSLDRLENVNADILFAGHGAPIHEPRERIEWLRDHRTERLRAAQAALTHDPQSLDALIPQLYADVPQKMWPAAARNLLATLIELENRGVCQSDPAPGLNAHFRLP